MSHKTDKRIIRNEPLKIWFWGILTLILLCALSYSLLFKTVMSNIIGRENMDSQFSMINSRIVQLETEYIRTKNDITSELAGNIGFITAPKQIFVSSKAPVSGLSLLTSDN